MSIKLFFKRIADGTYLRLLLGLKRYEEIGRITGFNNATGQMPEGVEQFRSALSNLRKEVVVRGLEISSVIKVSIMVADGNFALSNWHLLDEMWLETFGVRAWNDPSLSLPGAVMRPLWKFSSNAVFVGQPRLPGAPIWVMLHATVES